MLGAEGQALQRSPLSICCTAESIVPYASTNGQDNLLALALASFDVSCCLCQAVSCNVDGAVAGDILTIPKVCKHMWA